MVVEPTHLKNMLHQTGSFRQIGVNIQKIETTTWFLVGLPTIMNDTPKVKTHGSRKRFWSWCLRCKVLRSKIWQRIRSCMGWNCWILPNTSSGSAFGWYVFFGVQIPLHKVFGSLGYVFPCTLHVIAKSSNMTRHCKTARHDFLPS